MNHAISFHHAKDADKVALICEVFNWAIEQLVPSEQSFYGERTYPAMNELGSNVQKAEEI